jgi:uncharacterized membrane protein (UPF0136 family)
MTANTILWVYIVVLVAGGLMGLLKAGSKVSLFTSLAFAAVLSLCAMHVVQERRLPDYILIALVFVFGARLAKTRQFMPMGMMALVTILALAARHLVGGRS